jgi:hypothetical protein
MGGHSDVTIDRTMAVCRYCVLEADQVAAVAKINLNFPPI